MELRDDPFLDVDDIDAPWHFLFFAVSVAGNSTKEVLEVNKDQVITSVNASAVHDPGLICHSYDMSDVNMTNKTFCQKSVLIE